MNKVVIIGSDSNSIRFIEGEEVTLSIIDIKNKIKDLDSKIIGLDLASYDNTAKDLKSEVDNLIKTKLSEVEASKSKLDKEFSDFKDSLSLKLEEDLDKLNKRKESSEKEYSELVRERDKYKAILGNQTSQAVEEDKVRVEKDETVQKPKTESVKISDNLDYEPPKGFKDFIQSKLPNSKLNIGF